MSTPNKLNPNQGPLTPQVESKPPPIHTETPKRHYSQHEEGIVPPLLRPPSLDSISFWNKYVSFGCAFEVLWFAVGLPRAMRSVELWDPPTEDKIASLAGHFDRVYNSPKFTTAPYPYPRWRYLKALHACCKTPLILSALFTLLRIAGEMATPFLTNFLVTAIQKREFNGLYYALGILGCLSGMTIAQQQQLRFGELALNRCRSVTNYVVYR
eukprot:PhF_6_TR12799/c0_g1_i1/m.20179